MSSDHKWCFSENWPNGANSLTFFMKNNLHVNRLGQLKKNREKEKDTA